MTPADRIREVLAAHGVDPQTVSLSGPRTLLGEELECLLLREQGKGYDVGKRQALTHAASLVARQATDDEGDHWRRLALAIRDEADGKRTAEVEPVRAGESPSDLRAETAAVQDLAQDLIREWEAAEARHRRHLARLRWRAKTKRLGSNLTTERLAYREGYCDGLEPRRDRYEWILYHGEARSLPIAGPKGTLP